MSTEDKPRFNTSIFTQPASDLASSLTRNPTKSSPSPTRSAAARTRAMSITEEWKPIVDDRRQSWSAQEYSHQMHSKLAQTHDQRGSISDRLVERDNGQGFSER
ncbi:hypothetical protein QBC40DRAFT_353365 [Triangularia verruculosa]|uniref:Uncharacterized protein n=1 Tax=Triangularia verruculosa TaxID=2587418 RepID=A0AAN6X631_9PEZI|nr:hypothetical protein QBC40DRAFT_353365 [Triangularia verruculosa]